MAAARPAKPECEACSGKDLRLYPQDFPDISDWPVKFVSVGMRLAGGLPRSQPLWVCMSCGHNQEPQ